MTPEVQEKELDNMRDLELKPKPRFDKYDACAFLFPCEIGRSFCGTGGFRV